LSLLTQLGIGERNDIEQLDTVRFAFASRACRHDSLIPSVKPKQGRGSHRPEFVAAELCPANLAQCRKGAVGPPARELMPCENKRACDSLRLLYIDNCRRTLKRLDPVQ